MLWWKTQLAWVMSKKFAVWLKLISLLCLFHCQNKFFNQIFILCLQFLLFSFEFYQLLEVLRRKQFSKQWEIGEFFFGVLTTNKNWEDLVWVPQNILISFLIFRLWAYNCFNVFDRIFEFSIFINQNCFIFEFLQKLLFDFSDFKTLLLGLLLCIIQIKFQVIILLLLKLQLFLKVLFLLIKTFFHLADLRFEIWDNLLNLIFWISLRFHMVVLDLYLSSKLLILLSK